MPLYEYMCKKCMKITTELVIRDKEITKCKFCGENTAKKILSSPSGFNIKGYSAKNGYSKGEK